MGGILLASGQPIGVAIKGGMAPDKIVLYAGIFTLAATVYCVTVVPDFLVRFVLWMLTHTIFRIRIVGAGKRSLPRAGALLVA